MPIAVTITGRPAQGSRNEVLFGRLDSTGTPVVIKIGLTSGVLERERSVLAALGTKGGLVPRLFGAGAARIDGARVPCLIIERRLGTAPKTVEGWERMGRALARLPDMALPLGVLPTVDRTAFGHAHAQRIRELGLRLGPLRRSVADWDYCASAQMPTARSLVLTHGDPGPGNYLDDGHRGTLVDWEEAQIAPQGLDLARLTLIARLGSGPAGYVGTDHLAREAAAARGYRQGLSLQWDPAPQELRWWIAVAGIQFIHHRWRDPGPATWEHARDTLKELLTGPSNGAGNSDPP